MGDYRRVVVLTGAGISAESGLGTFRDKDGLWTRYDLRQVATPEGFAADPDLVHAFYNARRRNLLAAEPNPAHFALAELEAAHPGRVLVITQNVDDLHERAGSRNLLHMHGELLKVRCERCDSVQVWHGDLDTGTPCPACGLIGELRPHVVWFGEMPLYMTAIEAELTACDLFISIGTSGTVYPAAGFVAAVRARGSAETVELNLEKSDGTKLFSRSIQGPASQIVPNFIKSIL